MCAQAANRFDLRQTTLPASSSTSPPATHIQGRTGERFFNRTGSLSPIRMKAAHLLGGSFG